MAKRKSTDFEKKLKIINDIKSNPSCSYSEIGKKHGVDKSSVSRFFKNRAHIEQLAESAQKNNKRSKKPIHPKLEDALLLWLKEKRSQNLPVDGPLLKEKADFFAKCLNITDFKKSEGWLTKFKSRNGIIFKTVQGEGTQLSLFLERCIILCTFEVKHAYRMQMCVTVSAGDLRNFDFFCFVNGLFFR